MHFQCWCRANCCARHSRFGFSKPTGRFPGLADRIDFERHDLAESFPDGKFDLVYALYLQSPIEFDRARALRRAAVAVAPGGHLLIVVHGSRMPWGWDADPDTRFPTPQEQLSELELPQDSRQVAINEAPEREAEGPNGETAKVADIVPMVRRSGGA